MKKYGIRSKVKKKNKRSPQIQAIALGELKISSKEIFQRMQCRKSESVTLPISIPVKAGYI